MTKDFIFGNFAMFLSVQSFLRPTTAHILTRVSTTVDGREANKGSSAPKLSPDGRFVMFQSSADNLVPDDTNNNSDLFLRNLLTGHITRISTATDGTQANGLTYGDEAQFSPNGRYVVFKSSAGNLVSDDSNGEADIFLKDLITGATTRLSTALDGAQANAPSGSPQFSPDGRYVAFATGASTLVNNDNNNAFDVVVKDLATGQFTRISVRKDGTEANNHSRNAKFSSDGRFVVFESDASNLVDNDDNNERDIFIRDMTTNEISLVSTTVNGTQANAWSVSPVLSASGRYILFESSASNLASSATNGRGHIFRKDLATGEVILVSGAANGEQGNASSTIYSLETEFSADGRYVVFQSQASNLVPSDTDNDFDIFRKDLVTGDIVCLSTAVDGAQSNGSSFYYHTSRDGRYAVFSSKGSNLITGDTNNSDDIFRVDLLYKANAAAIAEDRFVDLRLAVGVASNVTVSWGDGTSTSVAPTAGQAALNHAYATSGTKATTVTLVEGALTWNVAHTVDVAGATIVRNIALADTLSGGAGRDSLTGDGYANILKAGAGNDLLSALAGNDSLEGGTGNDTLNGSTGNDKLSGGSGYDRLSGGTGRDVFAFDDRETSSSKSRADYIIDFSGRGGDRMDLKLVDASTKKRGDQKFSFIGQEAFSKAGEVRYEKTKGATYVYLNTDSDKAAEAVIKLKGSFELSKGWFVL